MVRSPWVDEDARDGVSGPIAQARVGAPPAAPHATPLAARCARPAASTAPRAAVGSGG